MKSQSIYKVPKGKLVKIQLCYDPNEKVIDSVHITGDFFAYPEEAIEELEAYLHHVSLNERILISRISDFIAQHQVQFIGLNAEALTKAIMMCVT